LNVREVLQKRRSTREFLDHEISKEHLEILMEAAQVAPSASNRQPYRFIVIKDRNLMIELSEQASIQRFIRNAAVIFVGVGDPERERWYKVDIAIALQQICLQAVELGLGSCWIGAFEEASVKAVLKIPNHLRVVALLPIGMPAQDPPARPRKSLEELFSMNYFE
jgi:nitroreductase